MKSLLNLTGVLLLLAGSVIAQESPGAIVPAAGKAERAEQTADRFVRRFRETLDFEVVYREFFTADFAKRQQTLRALLDSNEQRDITNDLSHAEAEQAYTGFMNLYYLAGLYFYNLASPDEEESGEIKSEELFPAELLKALKSPSICIFFVDYLKNESCRRDGELFRNAVEVRRFIAEASQLASLFRRYMPENPFDSPNYRAYLNQLDWAGYKTSASFMDDDDESGAKHALYQVYRGAFVLNIIEENDEMKVLGIPVGN
jgi:hypothetical protein